MLTEIINLRSLVASKARLNAALRRQHSRVANNQSEALPSQSPALPLSHGFPNSLETVFLTQTDYFLIAVTGEQSRSLPTRLPGTNLLDEWIGDLPLIAEVVASQLAKITCPTGGNTSRTGSNGNPHPPAPDARASAVTARAPAQVALAL